MEYAKHRLNKVILPLALAFVAAVAGGVLFVPASYVSATDATVSNTDNNFSSSNSSEYIFSGDSIGAAASDRVIIVAVVPSYTTSSRTATVTLNGIEMTQIAEYFGVGATDRWQVTYFALATSTGTTADFAVTLDSNVGRCALRVYRTTGVGSLTPYDSGSDLADPATLDLNVPAGGIAIAAGFSGNDVNPEWTGLTEDSNSNQESRTVSAASASSTTAQTPLSVSLGWDAASSDAGGFAISLGPVVTGRIIRLNGNIRLGGVRLW